VKKSFFWGDKGYVNSGTMRTNLTALELSKMAEDYGAGEIMITNISHEGMMQGLDLNLVKLISENVNVPVIAHGGVYSLEHFKQGIYAGASAVAGGSFFVYSGKQKGILINYPSQQELTDLFLF
jgi:imidazole glycerol-phosphate synthase subunit HisF